MCLKESAQLVISGRGGGATEQTERVSEESRWTDERDGATKRKEGENVSENTEQTDGEHTEQHAQHTHKTHGRACSRWIQGKQRVS